MEAKAQLMMPPTPILKDNNWPLLTVTKGFFENLAQGAALPSSSGLREVDSRAPCQQQHDLLADTIKIVCDVRSAFAACMQKLLDAETLLASSSQKYPQTHHRHTSAWPVNMESKQQQRHNRHPRPETTFNVC